jgi:glutathione reductase (NADPH)
VQEFDLIVLGGGSGGLATAQRAAEYGARVAVFEPGRLGGTCVNVGCVPKKVMWNAAQIAHMIEAAPAYGFDAEPHASLDWPKLKHGRDAYVRRLNGIYERNLERKQVATIRASARLRGAHEVVSADGEAYSAAHVVIATGGHPRLPVIPGAGFGITSDGFFDLERRPDRVAIIGSGYVAVEFAGVLRALGSEVSVFVRYDGVIRHFDALLTDHLSAQMQAAGIDIVTGAVAHSVEGGESIALTTADGRRFADFDTLIWAIGRDPNTRDLQLDNAGVQTDNLGFIAVDDYQNTNVAGVYAIGDVAGRAELTPVAIAAGRRLADRVFGGQADRHLKYDLIPTVIFSHPPIGTVGLSEQQALQRYAGAGEKVRVYKTEFVPMFYALTDEKPLTAMKLVTVGADERVVGCHVIGPGADEMIQGFAVALSMGARKVDLDDTLAIHPTSAEELVTLR